MNIDAGNQPPITQITLDHIKSEFGIKNTFFEKMMNTMRDILAKTFPKLFSKTVEYIQQGKVSVYIPKKAITKFLKENPPTSQSSDISEKVINAMVSKKIQQEMKKVDDNWKNLTMEGNQTNLVSIRNALKATLPSLTKLDYTFSLRGQPTITLTEKNMEEVLNKNVLQDFVLKQKPGNLKENHLETNKFEKNWPYTEEKQEQSTTTTRVLKNWDNLINGKYSREQLLQMLSDLDKLGYQFKCKGNPPETLNGKTMGSMLKTYSFPVDFVLEKKSTSTETTEEISFEKLWPYTEEKQKELRTAILTRNGCTTPKALLEKLSGQGLFRDDQKQERDNYKKLAKDAIQLFDSMGYVLRTNHGKKLKANDTSDPTLFYLCTAEAERVNIANKYKAEYTPPD